MLGYRPAYNTKWLYAGPSCICFNTSTLSVHLFTIWDNIISNLRKLTFNHRSEKLTCPLQNIVVFMRCVIFHKEIS